MSALCNKALGVNDRSLLNYIEKIRRIAIIAPTKAKIFIHLASVAKSNTTAPSGIFSNSIIKVFI